MKRILIVTILMLALVGCSTPVAKKAPVDWKTTFAEKGFTEEEISSYGEILTNVGITDFHDVEIFENGRMHSIKGKIYDFESHRLHLTLEDRKLIFASVYGISEYGRGYNDELYYDIRGGYVGKFDYDKNIVLAYDK